MKLYGRSKKAIVEAIRICKDKNVLKEYLESKESEVLDIMIVLYDEEEIMRSYLESEIYEATQKAEKKGMKEGMKEGMKKGKKEGKKEGIQEANIEVAKRMLEDGTVSVEKIAVFSNLPLETVQHLAESLQAVSV